MHDIHWLFLGWFAKFLIVCAACLLLLHQAAQYWRKRRRQKASRTVMTRPVGFSVPRQ